jgi:uncharacterized membrane protein
MDDEAAIIAELKQLGEAEVRHRLATNQFSMVYHAPALLCALERSRRPKYAQKSCTPVTCGPMVFAWSFAAQALYVSLLGPAPPQSFTQFITTIFDTPQGWKLIGFGTGIGFVFAVLALSVSVVSFPMLLDRPIDAEAIDVEIEHPVVAPTIDVPIAIQTSIKAVLVNPFTMALWGLIVAGSLAIGFFLVFAGLAVVVPVLAHSTWHLYRKVVEPVGG